MGKLDRKIKRKQTKKAEKQLSEKIGLFNKIPESCLFCNTKFDRTNRVMISEWRVIVREKEVSLYCPACWEKGVKQ